MHKKIGRLRSSILKVGTKVGKVGESDGK